LEIETALTVRSIRSPSNSITTGKIGGRRIVSMADSIDARIFPSREAYL
jgi:hypothetical protein